MLNNFRKFSFPSIEKRWTKDKDTDGKRKKEKKRKKNKCVTKVFNDAHRCFRRRHMMIRTEMLHLQGHLYV